MLKRIGLLSLALAIGSLFVPVQASASEYHHHDGRRHEKREHREHRNQNYRQNYYRPGY